MIEKQDLDLLLPHQGNMSLLHQVIRWDQDSIQCVANSHRDNLNPLRKNSQLASVNAIEYAAQAMAIHRTLLEQKSASNAAPKVGFLATSTKVTFTTERLDTLKNDLTVVASCLTANSEGSLYQFELTHDDHPIALGQALVMLAEGL